MIKILIPQTDKKIKSNIRGFWKNDNKIYYDYLSIKQENIPCLLIDFRLEKLKEDYKQEAIMNIFLLADIQLQARENIRPSNPKYIDLFFKRIREIRRYLDVQARNKKVLEARYK